MSLFCPPKVYYFTAITVDSLIEVPIIYLIVFTFSVQYLYLFWSPCTSSTSLSIVLPLSPCPRCFHTSFGLEIWKVNVSDIGSIVCYLPVWLQLHLWFGLLSRPKDIFFLLLDLAARLQRVLLCWTGDQHERSAVASIVCHHFSRWYTCWQPRTQTR